MDLIKITTLKKGSGKTCSMNDWARISYKGYTGIDEPKKVYDSYKD